MSSVTSLQFGLHDFVKSAYTVIIDNCSIEKLPIIFWAMLGLGDGSIFTGTDNCHTSCDA